MDRQLGDSDIGERYRGFVIEPLCFGGKFSPSGFWVRRWGSYIKIAEHSTVESARAAIDLLAV